MENKPRLIDMTQGVWGHAISISASNIKPGIHEVIGHCTPLPRIDDTILFWFAGGPHGKYIAHLKVGSVKPFRDPPDMFVALVENTGPRDDAFTGPGLAESIRRGFEDA